MRRVVLIAVASCLLATSAAAQRAMTIIDLINLPSLSNPQLSPSGGQLIYEQSDSDWAANKRVSHIWRVRTDGTGTVRLTSGPDGESGARWSPDGRTIAFIRRDGEFRQLWLLPNDGGEARVLTAHDANVSNVAWAPDGSTLYFLAPDAKSAAQKARDKAKDDVYAFDENYQQTHLWKVTVATRAVSRITSGDFSVTDYALSRDGRRMAHHRAPNPLLGYALYGEVWVMDADGGHAVRITTNGVPESGATLSPDGSQVLFTAQANEKFETYYNGNVFVAPAAGGPARDLTRDLGSEITDATFSRDGSKVYAIANMGVHSELVEIPVAGGPLKALTNGQHALGAWTYDPALDRHVFTLDEPSHAGEVWTLPSGGTMAQVSHVFDQLARDFRLPRQERIEWKGADGATVEGLLFYPIDFQPGQRYPLVVQTHGGPQASDKFGFGRWSNYTQVLAARGYLVLQPNYRGSTGYGDPFLRDMVGHYFQNAHLDVMAGVDALIARGLADGDRLGKMGWSGGGHMTNKLITFTHRFKAASSGAGAANWVSMYAQSDVRTYRTPWFGGTPWQKDAPTDLYWDQSPLKYVANVTTPTIFLVGEDDPRVPKPQSVEMYRALTSLGVPTHLYVAPREPHGWAELRHQLFKVNAELDWFERYVTERAYTWEVAPALPDPAPSAAIPR